MTVSTTTIMRSRLTAFMAIVSVAIALATAVLTAPPPIQHDRYAPPVRQMRIMLCLASACLDTGLDVRTQYGYTYGTYPWPQIETWEK